MNKVQITFVASSALVIIILFVALFMGINTNVVIFALIPALIAVIAFVINERNN